MPRASRSSGWSCSTPACAATCPIGADGGAGPAESTGHRLPAPNPYGPFPLNMVMAGGDAALEELIGGIDRGLLVTRFWYTNAVHQKKVIITGMTRDQDVPRRGRPDRRPVRNLRFTESYLDVLAGVDAVSRERRCVRFLGGGVPAVQVSSFTFTGVTADGWWGVARRTRTTSPSGPARTGRSRSTSARGSWRSPRTSSSASSTGWRGWRRIRLYGGTGRADDGDEPPDREATLP